jgi:hypothetical protein
LVRWLEKRHGNTFEGTSDEARLSAGHHRDDLAQWWPSNGRAFADAVTRAHELLKAVGITVSDRKSNGKRLKHFVLDPEEVM